MRALAEKVAGGLDVIGVPTSERTAALARELGVPLTTLDETPELDLTVDGADELDARLQLIKGGGAALLREKIVAAASRRMVVIADDSKFVETLGRFPLPIEVMPFGLEATRRAVVRVADALSLKGDVVLRKAAEGSPLVTDGGHYILDAHWSRLPDVRPVWPIASPPFPAWWNTDFSSAWPRPPTWRALPACARSRSRWPTRRTNGERHDAFDPFLPDGRSSPPSRLPQAWPLPHPSWPRTRRPARGSDKAAAGDQETFTKEHLHAARAAIEGGNAFRSFDDILPVIADKTRTLFIRTNPSATKVIDEVTNEVALKLANRRPELDRTIMEVWARRFSTEELNEIAAFYQSPVGKKFAKLGPS